MEGTTGSDILESNGSDNIEMAETFQSREELAAILRDPRTMRILRGTARHLTNHNPADTEDLIQETFLKALRFSHRYKPGTNLRAWLCTILRRIFYSQYERKKLERETLDQMGTTSAFFAGKPFPGPDDLVVRFSDEVAAALDCINPEFAKALCLKAEEGLGQTEIAYAMDIPVSTAGTHLHRAQKALQPRLAEYAQMEYGIA